MGLFSFFRKNKQESASGQGEFLSRSAGESSAARGRGGNAGNARKSAKAGKDESVDPVLPEKKRARRRLIGAVALVLAVVIVLPMILDSEPRPLADDIAIQIPSKDGKDAAKDADAKPTAAATSAAQPKEEFVDPATLAPVGEKPAIAPGAPAMPSGPANNSLAQSKPAAQSAQSAQSAEPAEKPAAKPEPKADAKADVKESKSDTKTAAKPAERKDDHKKDAKDTKDVKETAKPKAADKPDDAARALAILEGKPASTDKKPATPAPAASGKFVIQVAALATQEKIDELRGKLSGAGIKSYTQKVATQSGDRTRIRVGPFASRDEADKMRAKIVKLGLPATVVPA